MVAKRNRPRRPKSRQMTIFLPEAVADRLEARAGLERRTRSQLAALLIEDALPAPKAAASSEVA